MYDPAERTAALGHNLFEHEPEARPLETLRLVRVGIDARLASRGRGIATALNGLVPALAEILDVVWIGDQTTAPDSVADCISPPGPFPVLDLNPRLVRGARLDVLHFAANTGWMWPGPVPTVLTVHDTIFMSSGVRGVRTVRQALGHRYMTLNVRQAVQTAEVVAVPSRATATELERRLPLDARPRIIPWGVHPPPNLAWEAQQPAFNYALAFAAPSPRKRLDLVMEAWESLWPETGIELWLVGGAGPAGSDSWQTAEGTGESGIRRFDYVNRGELWALLSGALALVYPSEEEGFGFPVLEGLAAGTPVLTGLAPATTELGGDAVLRLNPRSPSQSIVEGILRLQGDPELRRRLGVEGRARAEQFTWAAAARAYVECYEAALRSR
jgi:glycosyltransferase involved in cell wall biosynthesis